MTLMRYLPALAEGQTAPTGRGFKVLAFYLRKVTTLLANCGFTDLRRVRVGLRPKQPRGSTMRALPLAARLPPTLFSSARWAT